MCTNFIQHLAEQTKLNRNYLEPQCVNLSCSADIIGTSSPCITETNHLFVTDTLDTHNSEQQGILNVQVGSPGKEHRIGTRHNSNQAHKNTPSPVGENRQVSNIRAHFPATSNSLLAALVMRP